MLPGYLAKTSIVDKDECFEMFSSLLFEFKWEQNDILKL
jgi:hypothetical protein